jgi:predicted DNA binding CopG/RHH family protein
MPSARKPVPEFKSEAEERAFWEEHDTADYLDWSRAEVTQFPNLKLSTSTISLRLPAQLLADLKRLANKRDVPYQSLLKVYLAERVAAESARALPNKPLRRSKSPSSSRRPTRLEKRGHSRSS